MPLTTPPRAASPARPAPHGSIPDRAGVGLKPDHYQDIAAAPATAPAFFEVHPENYMSEGGPVHRFLSEMRELRPLSLHGVGMSLGSADGLDNEHLCRLAALVDRYQPALVSEHLSWSRIGGVFLPDLLPLPLTREALSVMVRHVDEVQCVLKRQILIENPSTYLEADCADFDEPGFIAELARRTGCGWLLDINNVVVGCTNHGRDATAYIDAVDGRLVGEIHLAGHATEMHAHGPLLIDDHGSKVGGAAWALYARLIERIGPRPTLIEWDTNIPVWRTLLSEATVADQMLVKRISNAA